MRIQYLAQMAIAATLSMGLVVGCGANPCSAKTGEPKAATTEKKAPCASKAAPCAGKKAPCASKAAPCASKKP